MPGKSTKKSKPKSQTSTPKPVSNKPGIYYGDLPPRHRPPKVKPPKSPKTESVELRSGPEIQPDSQ